MIVIDLTGLSGAMGAAALPVARIQTASIGIPDTLFLMLLALVVFGPRRLPEIGRQIGKLMYEFRKVSNDFKFQMEEELRASEEAERLRKVQAAAPKPLPPQVAQPAPLELEAATAPPEADTVPDAVPAVTGEVRAETPKIPQLAPPATGEPVAAQHPFRGRFSPAGQELDAQDAQDAAGSAGTEEEVRHG